MHIGGHFSIEVGKLFLIPIFFGCQFDVSFLFQCCYSGDESIPTCWKFITTKADTEEDQDENYSEEIRSIFNVNLSGGRDEYGLEGRVQKSKLLGWGDVDLIHIAERITIEPLCFYQM